MGLTDQQIAYCRYRSDGNLSKRDAYQKAYPNAKKTSAHVLASKLDKKPEIQAEIARLQKYTETPLTLSRQEKREFLAKVVRCDARKLEEDSPLVQSVTHYYDKDGNRIRTVLKIPNKNQAIEIDNKMAGHNEPEEMNHNFLGGVMVIPADANSLSDFEKMAFAQQETLKKSSTKPNKEG